jgi:hypothetical protein
MVVDKTDKFKPRPARTTGPAVPSAAPPPPPPPPPLWFGLVVGGFIGALGTTSLAVGMYWMGVLDVNVDALWPTEEPVAEVTETPEPLADLDGSATAVSVIVNTPTTGPTETETPMPTQDWAATATDACGAFMDEFPGTPCPSPVSP